MINHARTLLLNRPASGRPPIGVQGEEYMDPGFRGVEDTAELYRVRRALFGSAPDFMTENYRLLQYEKILEADPHARIVLQEMDSRKTPDRDGFLLTPGTAITRLDGDGELLLSGEYLGNAEQGKHYRSFLVTESEVSAYTVFDYMSQRSTPFTGSSFLLPGTSIRVSTAGVTDRPAVWLVRMHARPQRTVPEIMDRISDEDLLTLASGDGEPWETIRSLIRAGGSRRIVGSLLAVVMRTESLRGA